MTSVTGISSASLYTSSMQTTLDKQMKPAADLLGMTVDATQQAMRGGKTLADLAKTAGVSESDMEAAIAKGLTENTPAGGTALDADQAAGLATAIATGKAPSSALSFSSNKTLMDYISDDEATDATANGTSGSSDSLATLLNPNNTSSTSSTAGASTSATSLDALAKALGTDTDTLSQQLQSGDTASLSAEITAKFGKTAGIQFDSSL